MPAHPARAHRGGLPRVGSWLLIAPVLALALLLSGCGGKSVAKKPEAQPSAANEPSASSSTSAAPAADPEYGAPKVGACYRMTPEQSVASVSTSRKVSCKSAHTSVVAHVGFLRAPVTPTTPVSKRKKLGKKLCEPAYRRFVGGTLADRAMSILTWTLFTPGQAELERGARWVRCDVIARSGPELVRLPTRAPLLARGIPDELRVCQTATGSDVSCGQTHAFKVAAVFPGAAGRGPRPAYPNVASYTATARARCQQLTGKQGGYWQPPSPAGWKAGDHFIRCLVREP